MGDGRRHYVEFTMVRTGAVVHAVNPTTGAFACNGRHAASQTEPVVEPQVVSCLWCLTGQKGDGIRWFKWGDGT